jgi:hypothetical protein
MSDAIAEMVERYRADGFELPETWEGRMEAVVNGAVDFDDAQELIAECVDIADRTSGDRPGDGELPLMWSSTLGCPYGVAIDICGSANPKDPLAVRLVRCGRVADAVCALVEILSAAWPVHERLRRHVVTVSNWLHLLDTPADG